MTVNDFSDSKQRRPVMDEDLFRSTLIAERKRADRSNEALGLLIVAAKDADAADSPRTWAGVIVALEAVVRGVDMFGWSQSRKAIGVIFPELRAAATFALRWVESDQADDLLRRSLATDSNASVRLEAAFAFGFRKITAGSFQIQKRALVTDNDAQVRLAAMRNLWQARDTFPEARRLVQQTIVKDRAREVRRAAADFLARSNSTD